MGECVELRRVIELARVGDFDGAIKAAMDVPTDAWTPYEQLRLGKMLVAQQRRADGMKEFRNAVIGAMRYVEDGFGDRSIAFRLSWAAGICRQICKSAGFTLSSPLDTPEGEALRAHALRWQAVEDNIDSATYSRLLRETLALMQ